MINIKHLFLPYNPYARFNPVAYGGLGVGHTFGSKFDPWSSVKEGQNVTAVNNIVGKAGLQLSYTLSDPVSIYLNLEGMLVPEDFERYVGGLRSMEGLANITVGISCNLGFKHSIKAPFYDNAEIAALNETINVLRQRPETCPVCPACPECPECPECPNSPANTATTTANTTILEPVFFTIDNYQIRENQFGKITQAANYLLANPEAKLILASYADVKTGNPAHNWTLSNNRSKAVAKVLTSLGIASDRLILKYYGDTVQPFETNELNRATLFIKEQ